MTYTVYRNWIIAVKTFKDRKQADDYLEKCKKENNNPKFYYSIRTNGR